jgi:hypothetical protein
MSYKGYKNKEEFEERIRQRDEFNKLDAGCRVYGHSKEVSAGEVAEIFESGGK